MDSVVSASYAATASFVTGSIFTNNNSAASASYALSSSYADTSSYAPNYVLNSQTGSFVLNSQTSSFITNSQTSSFITNNQTGSMSVLSSSYSATASYALNSPSAGIVGGANIGGINVIPHLTSAFVAANTPSYTANSAASYANAAFIKANSSLQNTTTITVNTDLTVPGILTVNGPLYAGNTILVPTIFAGPQTAITLDFTNSRMVKANLLADLVVTPGSFVPGKIVDLILTNTSGQQHVITHGCAAINSTVGSTSYNMPGGSTISARYVCLDGTLANTMCAITHA